MRSFDPNQPLDVRVITPNTIPELAKTTRWSEQELWKEYRRSVQHGTAVMILVTPIEDVWERAAVAAAFAKDECYYEMSRAEPYLDEWVCVVHQRPSRHHVAKNVRRPCLGKENNPQAERDYRTAKYFGGLD